MYAFRKPFAAGTYEDVGLLLFGLDYNSGLLIAQVIGYALSKLIGIRVIAEFGRQGRAAAISGLIGEIGRAGDFVPGVDARFSAALPASSMNWPISCNNAAAIR